MRYCIHDGELFKIYDSTARTFYLEGLYKKAMVEQSKVVEVPEEIVNQHLAEYKIAVATKKEIMLKLLNLNDEYYKAHKALHKERQYVSNKEVAIIIKMANEALNKECEKSE